LNAKPQGVNAALLGLLNDKNEDIVLQFELELRGMEALELVPLGLDTTVSISSNWQHPQFSGMFLPTTHNVEESGYQAKWHVSAFASNIVEKVKGCENGNCKALLSSVFGVNHIEPVDVYLRSERSVKYSLLFIGLSFISFFLFELLKKLPIHPIQYTLVGCAIALFYMLLFSLSEHVNFFVAYFFATVSCVSLMFFYLMFVLKGKKEAAVFSILLSILYSLLFVIISAEDYGLLMGSVLSFVTLAVVMMFTRNIDWYEAGHSIKKMSQADEPTEFIEEY
jgi:inner membrane protein